METVWELVPPTLSENLNLGRVFIHSVEVKSSSGSC